MSYINMADDKQETERLIFMFTNLKKKRNPFYLEEDDLEKILSWKLRTQYNRQKKIRDERNTAENIKTITQAAFAIEHKDERYETELRLRILKSLTGVEIPVASAILTLCYPEKYSVIDVRNWRQVYPGSSPKTDYSYKEYNDYLDIIKSIASKFNVTPQKVDMAIWAKDMKETKEKHSKS